MSAASATQTVVVDSLSSLECLLDNASDLPSEPPSIFIDLEGIRLGRKGSISIISIYIAPKKIVYLVDIYTLGSSALSTTNAKINSLQTLLGSSVIPKVIFDVRNDSDALYSLYQVSVDGIEDLQLMKLGCRRGSKDHVMSLAKCIEYHCPIHAEAQKEWQETKCHATQLFDPEKGGRYEIFNERPLNRDIIRYCTQHVTLLPELYNVYNSKLQLPGEMFWREEVRKATKQRIKLSQSPEYDGQAKDKVQGPWDDSYIEQAPRNGSSRTTDERSVTCSRSKPTFPKTHHPVCCAPAKVVFQIEPGPYVRCRNTP